jgi:2-oxoglutarate ferredoxin oxidoreductase subunit alpha
MMEPFYPTPYVHSGLPEKDWLLNGCKGREPRVIKSLYMGDGELEMRNDVLQEKYRMMKRKETRFESYYAEDSDVVVVSFGIVARIALSPVMQLRRKGFKVGLFRPVTLFPFPEEELLMLSGANRKFITIEMNAGQMVEDVKLSVNGRSEVLFYGRTGGSVITPEEVEQQIMQLLEPEPQLVRKIPGVGMREGLSEFR